MGTALVLAPSGPPTQLDVLSHGLAGHALDEEDEDVAHVEHVRVEDRVVADLPADAQLLQAVQR